MSLAYFLQRDQIGLVVELHDGNGRHGRRQAHEGTGGGLPNFLGGDGIRID